MSKEVSEYKIVVLGSSTRANRELVELFVFGDDEHDPYNGTVNVYVATCMRQYTYKYCSDEYS